MVTRLLPHSEIDRRKAEEQRQAIQEGLKVAERVDTLREVLASEETVFENYRTGTLAGIQEQINEKYAEKQRLIEEIEQLRKTIPEPVDPFDPRWEQIAAQEEELRNKATLLGHEQAELAEKAMMLIVREREIAEAEEKTNTLSQLASAIHHEAERIRATAREEAAAMRNKAQTELMGVENKRHALLKLESDVMLQEAQCEEKEIRLNKVLVDLEEREETLRAGWRNLERTITKLHKPQ